MAILGVVAVAATMCTFLFGPRPKYKLPQDWTISPLECTPTDDVTITLTNLSQLFRARKFEPIHFDEGDKICRVIRESTGSEVRSITAGRAIDVCDRQTWTLTLDNFPENGTYQLLPLNWPYPLHKRITVSGKVSKETKETDVSQQ